jgi:hypothetical protein
MPGMGAGWIVALRRASAREEIADGGERLDVPQV